MKDYEVLPSSCFEFICRTCLMHNELYSIDKVSWEGINLRDIILNWTTLEIEEHENLPKQMCRNCVKYMYQIYHFLSKCKRAEWTLKSILFRDGNDVERHDRILDIAEINMTKEQNTEGEESIEDNTEMIDASAIDSNDENLTDSEWSDPNLNSTSSNECYLVKREIGTDTYEIEIPPGYFEDDENILDEIQNVKNDLSNAWFMQSRKLNKTMIGTSSKLKRSYNGIKKYAEMRARRKRNVNQNTERSPDSENALNHHVASHSGTKASLDGHRKSNDLSDSDAEEILLFTGNEDDNSMGSTFTCSMCSLDCKTERELMEHMLNHIGKQLYTCNVCGQAFAELHNCVKHTELHSLDKNFACNVCEETFASFATLKEHIHNAHGSV